MKTYLNQHLEQYIMTPNYPDDYPNNYEEVILKFPCFPLNLKNAQYSRHGHCSQQPGNLLHSHLQHLIWITAGTGWRLMTAPPPSATVASLTLIMTTVAATVTTVHVAMATPPAP